jgi:hypothetical protein
MQDHVTCDEGDVTRRVTKARCRRGEKEGRAHEGRSAKEKKRKKMMNKLAAVLRLMLT